MLTPIRRKESGQVLIVVALILPMLLGMAALAVDLGNYASERRSLQNSADSIALASSRDLPSSDAAVASGQAWATKNGVPLSAVTITVTQASTGNPNPTVTVDVKKGHNFVFGRVIGLSSKNVGAHAVAIKTSPGGLAGVSPWSVLQSAEQAATPGAEVTLKYDATNPTNGNFGIMQLDLMSNTDPHCDTFTEVFSGPVNGQYNLNPLCNPWLDGSYPSLRVIIIPVISSLCNGSCSVTVVSFALFWLDGYPSGQCTGNTCEIQGRFVNANIDAHALAGTYDPNSSIHFVKRTQ